MKNHKLSLPPVEHLPPTTHTPDDVTGDEEVQYVVVELPPDMLLSMAPGKMISIEVRLKAWYIAGRSLQDCVRMIHISSEQFCTSL